MRSFPGNPYDGHTLKEALEQVAILTNQRPDMAVVDRGYRSQGRCEGTATRPPSLIAAIMLVVAIASRELVASVMLAPAGLRTQGTSDYSQFEQRSGQTGVAISLIAVTITSGILLAVNLWLARQGGSAFAG